MKSLTLFIAYCLFTLFSVAQSTTEEEFNYLTKGYKIQIESGLDMKKGYSMKDLGDYFFGFSDAARYARFKGLFRDGQDKPCAVLMIYERKVSGNVNRQYYFCIPTIDATYLWNRTIEDIRKLSDGQASTQMLEALTWGLMKLCSQNLELGNEPIQMQSGQNGDAPVTIAQEMPTYPGGEEQIMNDLQRNIIYPELEKENKIEGTVYIQFVVEKDGSVTEVKAIRGIQGGPNLTRSAELAVMKLKRFNPAKQNGRPVRLVMTIPVNFHLD